MNSYILSYHLKEKDKKIIFPKWWEFWKRAKIVEYEYWDRKTHKFSLDEETCDKLIQTNFFSQFAPKGSMYLQLELLQETTDYVTSEGKPVTFYEGEKLEEQKTNLLLNTEEFPKINYDNIPDEWKSKSGKITLQTTLFGRDIIIDMKIEKLYYLNIYDKEGMSEEDIDKLLKK